MKPRQLPLGFPQRPALGGEDFLVAPSNADAVAWLDRWPDWPQPALVIHGPPGCGKTHLSHVFQAMSGAAAVDVDELASADPMTVAGSAPAVVIDDAKAALDAGHERSLLHLYNVLKESGRHMLLTAGRPPSQWRIGLPDLASRMNAAVAVAIRAPDEALIQAVLVKLFADRQLKVDADVIAYVLPRIERSFAAVGELVAALDAEALAHRRNITVPLAAGVLSRLSRG